MVSVIIPVYNSEKYLDTCLESVISQNIADMEILLINDGSSDNSRQLCDSWTLKDSKIKVYHKENGGVSSARNLGIEKAVGDYLIFLDADDTLKPGILKKMSETISSTVSDICIGGFEYVYKNSTFSVKTTFTGTYKKSDFMSSCFDNLYSTNVLSAVTSKLYSRNIIIQNNLRFNEELVVFEDILFALENLSKANRISVIDEDVFSYIQTNSQSALSKYQSKFSDSTVAYVKRASSVFPKDNYLLLCTNVIMRAFRQEYRLLDSKACKNPTAVSKAKGQIIEHFSSLNKCTENISLLKIFTDSKINKDAKLVCLLLKLKCYKSLYKYGLKKEAIHA